MAEDAPKIEEVKIEEVEEDSAPALEEDVEDDSTPAGPGRSKQSRSEKKTRKQMQKLGMKVVPDISRVTVKKGAQVLFVLSHPDVFKSPTADTYVLFGEAKMDDAGAGLSQAAAALSGAGGADAIQAELAGDSDVPALEDDSAPAEAAEGGNDEETGLTEKDIDLVMKQADCTRERAIEELKKSKGDIVNAIMTLTV